MTKWDNPYPRRLFSCPGCRRHALPGPLNTWVVRFEHDPNYDHFLWDCPSSDCSTKGLVLPAAGALEAFIEAGYRVVGSPAAPYWVRLMVRQLWRQDPDTSAAITPADQERFWRQVQTLHDVDEFQYLCGS
jgi:hypothetical protein